MLLKQKMLPKILILVFCSLLLLNRNAFCTPITIEPSNYLSSTSDFIWPPTPYLNYVFEICSPEPWSDSELKLFKDEIKKNMLIKNNSRLSKGKYLVLQFLAEKKYDVAKNTLEDLSKTYPNEPEIIWTLGFVNILLNQPNEAWKEFYHLTELAKDNRNWLIFAKQSQALTLISMDNPDDAYELLHNDVENLQGPSSLRTHQGWFTYYLYGLIWTEKLQHEAALKSFRVARLRWIKGPKGKLNNPILRHLNLLTADSYMATRNYNDAQGLYLNLALSRRSSFGLEHPLSLEAEHRLILSYYAVGDLEKILILSESFLKKAPGKFSPTSPEMLDVMILDAKASILKKDWQKAEISLKELIFQLEQNPDKIPPGLLLNTYLQKGSLLLQTNRNTEANNLFTATQKLACHKLSDSNLTGACLAASYQVSLVLARQGEIQKAQEILKIAKIAAEENNMARDCSYQYAAVASLLAELENNKPTFDKFADLNY